MAFTLLGAVEDAEIPVACLEEPGGLRFSFFFFPLCLCFFCGGFLVFLLIFGWFS